jgi:hypothetical protein
MLQAAQFFGGLFLFVIGPAILTGATIGYGLYNPSTGLGKWVYKWWPFGMPKKVQERVAAEGQAGRTHLKQVTKRVLKAAQLMVAKVETVLTILSQKVSVTGRILLLKLESFDGNMKNKVHIDPRTDKPLPEFPWLSLDDGRVIAYLPDKEGGNWKWFIADDVVDVVEVSPTTFLKPYGVEFAKSDQQARVVFSYPGLKGHEWRCTDILWANCQAEGENRFGSPNDTTQVSFLLSKDDESGEFLLFAQVRGGTGNHGLYILREFKPEVEIEDLL